MFKKHWLPIGLALFLVLVLGYTAFGDEVETVDKRTFTGSITQGIPETVTLNEQGVVIQIKRRAIKEIRFSEGTVEIIVITDNTFRGELVSSLPSKIFIKTKSGLVEIRPDKLKRITFPRKSIGVTWTSEVEVKDGRSPYQGTGITGLPESFSIDVKDITMHISVKKVREIKYGTEDEIETVEQEIFKGKITSSTPSKVTLYAPFGQIEIKTELVKRISLRKATRVSAPSPDFSPRGSGEAWENYFLQGAVGSLGCAGGFFIGGSFLGVLGAGIGCASLASTGVTLVGAAYGTEANPKLAGLTGLGALGGFIVGFVAPVPNEIKLYVIFLAAGFGAATGYNIAAEHGP